MLYPLSYEGDRLVIVSLTLPRLEFHGKQRKRQQEGTSTVPPFIRLRVVDELCEIANDDEASGLQPCHHEHGTVVEAKFGEHASRFDSPTRAGARKSLDASVMKGRRRLQRKERSMEHKRAEDIEWTPAPEEHFTGKVWFGPLSSAEGGIQALAVQFEPSARTDWHTHENGQVLYVVQGAGLVQNEQGATVEISPGDVVYSPPGETHWHGAQPASPMLHLSLTTEEAAWEPRKVTDEEYGRRRKGSD